MSLQCDLNSGDLVLIKSVTIINPGSPWNKSSMIGTIKEIYCVEEWGDGPGFEDYIYGIRYTDDKSVVFYFSREELEPVFTK